jgi:hypothetical protein
MVAILKRFTKQDWIIFGALQIVTLSIIIAIFTWARQLGFVYASVIDSLFQFRDFAEDFRQLFYQSHQLLPQFIHNLGGGQNAFNLTYYGLGNPLIILSYFLPFVSMYAYWVIIMTLIVLATIGLIYIFLRQRFDSIISLVATICTLVSMPLVFNTHNEYVFITYLPFLMLALFGVDSYFRNSRYWQLILGVFFISLINYYFLLSCCLTIGLYTVFVYFEKFPKKFALSLFLKNLWQVSFRAIVGLALSAVILVPTGLTIWQGARQSQTSVNLAELLLPNPFAGNDEHALGLTAAWLLFLLVLLFYKNKAWQITSLIWLIIVTFPIFDYLINGGLYIWSKCFVPMLPLLILLTAGSLCVIRRFFMSSELVIYKKTALVFLSCVLIISISSSSLKFNNPLDASGFIPYKNLQSLQSQTLNNSIDQTLNSDVNNGKYRSSVEYDSSLLPPSNKIFNANYFSDSIYASILNKPYERFFRNSLQIGTINILPWYLYSNNNALSAIMLGCKYLFYNSNNSNAVDLPRQIAGFTKVNQYTFKNDKVFSLGYASDKVFSSSTQMNNLQLVQSLISGISKDNSLTSKTLPDVSNLESLDLTNIFNKVGKNPKSFFIDTPLKINYKLPIKLHNKLLFIKITMLNDPNNFIHKIDINGNENAYMKNKYYGNNNNELKYVISPNQDGSLDDLVITISKRLESSKDENVPFKIKQIEAFTMPVDSLLNAYKSFDQMEVTNFDTNGLKGNINISKPNSIMAFSIGYDKGFSLKIDGKDTPIFQVNGGIIGANISKGQHSIELSYVAPGFYLGCVISLIVLVSLIGFSVWQSRIIKKSLFKTAI